MFAPAARVGSSAREPVTTRWSSVHAHCTIAAGVEAAQAYTDLKMTNAVTLEAVRQEIAAAVAALDNRLWAAVPPAPP